MLSQVPANESIDAGDQRAHRTRVCSMVSPCATIAEGAVSRKMRG
jgi:hypothetical protein